MNNYFQRILFWYDIFYCASVSLLYNICLSVCKHVCPETFIHVYKKTLTYVRLTINFIPSDKNISLFCFMFACMNV